jgi:hypothetical protein
MSKITVYQYETYDSETGEYVRSKRPTVRAAIDSLNGVILFETAMEVELDTVDKDGG